MNPKLPKENKLAEVIGKNIEKQVKYYEDKKQLLSFIKKNKNFDDWDSLYDEFSRLYPDKTVSNIDEIIRIIENDLKLLKSKPTILKPKVSEELNYNELIQKTKEIGGSIDDINDMYDIVKQINGLKGSIGKMNKKLNDTSLNKFEQNVKNYKLNIEDYKKDISILEDRLNRYYKRIERDNKSK